MAATQAESQQNEVNREQVQQEQPPDLSNAVLQNGTEKNGGRGIVGSDNLVNSKSKSPGQNSLSAEMSQYRQESGAGPPIHNNAGNGEQNTNSASVDNNKLNSDGKPYPQNSEQSVGNDQNYGKGSDSGRNMQGYGSPSLGFPARGNYHPDQHSSGNPVQNSADSGNLHQNHPFSQFSSQSMRHGFPSSKPMPGTPMVPPRPPSGGPNMNAPSGGFSPHGQQQRFMSGQSISQPTGPTPTLNQLLQSSNPVHRYTNSYGEFGMQKTGPEQGSPGNMPYNQQWQPQRPLASYSPQQVVPGYRNQPPGGRGSQQPPYTPGPGAFPPQQQQQQQPQPQQPSQAAGPASQPGAPSQQQQQQQQQHQYPPYPQRYPTPPGPGPGPGPGSGAPARQPFPPHQTPPHQLNTPYGQPVGPSGQPPQSPQQQQQQQQHGGYGEQRGGAWGPSQSPHPPTQPPAAQQPPHPPQSPHPAQQPPPSPLPSPGAHQPQPSPQPPPPSPSQQHTQQQSQFPNRPQQPSTPNAHAPDTGDLTGANSNDSSSGLGPTGPGTPGMRPTPSPTGSTGSRSMSPAVQGQQNIPMGPHPSSGQSDGSTTRMSHSPMATQGGYQQQPLAPPPHMHGGYKIGAPTPQQMSPYTPQGQQQYPQGNFNPRAQGQVGSMQYGPSQGYGPGPTGQQSPQANNMGSGQYPGRGMPNHVSPHSQFGYQGGWGGPAMNQGPPAMMGGKGGPPTNPSQPPATPPGPRPHTPPHYLKQHLQHKMGFGAQGAGMPPSPGPGPPYGPGGIGNAGSPGMGPPGNMSHMGSPMGPPPAGHHHSGMAPPTSMGPPGPGSGMGPPSTVSASGPLPNSHGGHEGPMPPPPSNSHPPHGHEMPDTHDNGIPAPGPGGATNSSVTSVVTTGPDGTPLDEGSQQSTLSNASAASGEEPGCPPKSRKEPPMGYPPHGHPPTPQSTAPSPGAASVNSMHEEYGEVNSPSWPRTPASPVFNSHVHQDPYRAKGSHPLGESKKPGKKLGKKPDSLCKLYEMDESHERRMWLDKLLQYMEERGTPISACPTISKNPLDLFRLYLFVKERGGFMEVTKNKTWKDIAGLLGIGASSSAAYTLRKHYTKNLLAFECHFDRGGIDPQPIINQVEATSKKKGAKAASVPSPGSSNSQDSFPAGSSGSMDGYGYGYQPGAAPDYNSPAMQRPASQTNAPSPHPGALGAHLGAGDNISVSNPFEDTTGASGPRTPSAGMQPGYQGGQGGYSQYPDQYNRGPEFNQQYPPGPAGSYPPNRPMYPPYPEGGDRSYQQGSNPPAPGMQPSGASDPYNRYMGTQPPGYPSRTGYAGPPQPPTAPPNAQQPGGYPPQQDYYRQDQMHSSSQLARQLVAPQSPIKSPYQGYPGQPPSSSSPYPGGPSKTMPPPAPQPRRHPDFAKDQQQPPFPPYGQQRPPSMYAGWNNNQYRGQGYPGQGPVGPQGPQPWNQGPPRPPGPPNSQPANNQWDQHRYPNSGQPPYPPQQSPQQWPPNMASSGPNSLRPSMGPRPPFRPEGKQFGPMPPPPGMKGNMSQPYPQQSTPKREIIFPLESVEATMPVLYKRKRMAKSDVSPVEAWRLMMSLKSGLLAESCWALDVLNILLFDDTSVVYFGLGHMPGLLDVLLEHFRKALANMFDALPPTQPDCKWYDIAKPENMEVDLGSVSLPVECSDRFPLLEATTNYTLQTRKGEQIRVVSNEDIFVLDTHKVWDVEGETTELSITAEVNHDPWQLATADHVSTKYIVSCFQGEFGTVPFVRLLPDRPARQPADDIPDTSLRLLSPKPEPVPEPPGPEPESAPAPEKTEVSSSEKANVISKEDVVVSKELVIGVERKNCEKKKRTKTLSDVLSRIKKEPVEVNDVLTREIREKVEQNEIVLKKEAREEEKSVSNGKTNVSDDKAEEPKTNLPVTNEEPAKTMETGSREELPAAEVAKPVEETPPVEEVTTPVEESDPTKTPEVKEEIKEEIDEELNKLQIRDPAGTLKRRRVSDYEDECYARDEASLYLVTETQDSVARRCLCLSNILRNLTFVPGNELEFAKSGTFLGLLGKLLLLHHEHPARTQKQRNYDREEDADFADSCSSLQGEGEWWWEFLHHIRENVLVTAANIAGHMDLSQHPEEVSRPVLDGLLHWAVCPAAHGQDPFPSATSSSPLSPQRLALEALCKLCVTDANVDLVLATPPYSRLERLCAVLTKFLSRSEEQVLREFAVNLLHYLAAADSGMARTVALQSPCVSLLVAFVEQAEASALGVANQHGIGALRDNPDSMGTSLDMLRRAAGTLLHLARHPDNRPLFLQQEQRLLALVMSQILDQQVASVISRVLFQCSRPVPETQHRPPS